MALTTLSLSAIEAATGWTSATTTVLNTSDNSRATGGTVGEFITATLSDVPTGFYQVNGDVVLRVEAIASGVATRAKSILLELLDSSNNVLGSGTTGTVTTTEQTFTITVSSRTDLAIAVNGWKIRATVQEGAGMADAITVSIDLLNVDVNYTVEVPHTGAATGQAAAAGTVGVDVPLTGAATGQATATGTFEVGGGIEVELTGAATGAASAAATAVVEIPGAGAAEGAASASGTLYVEVPLTGDSVGQATSAGIFGLITPLVGDVTGQAAVAGTLSNGSGTLTIRLYQGALLIKEWTPLEPDALEDFQLTLSTPERDSITDWSALRVELIADGSEMEVTHLYLETPPASTEVPLTGAVTGTATASATPWVVQPFAGAATGTATVAGTIDLLASLSGAAVGQASADATLYVIVPLTGAVAGQATALGSLLGGVPLSGNAAGQGEATGTLYTTKDFVGTVAAVAALSGTLTLELLVTGAVTGQANAQGALEVLVSATGAATGAAEVGGTLYVEVPLTGEVTGTASVAGTLVARSALTTSASVTIAARVAKVTTATVNILKTQTVDTAASVGIYSPFVAVGMTITGPGDITVTRDDDTGILTFNIPVAVVAERVIPAPGVQEMAMAPWADLTIPYVEPTELEIAVTTPAIIELPWPTVEMLDAPIDP